MEIIARDGLSFFQAAAALQPGHNPLKRSTVLHFALLYMIKGQV